MESAKRRRESRKKKKLSNVENWKLQLGIQGSNADPESNEESYIYFVLKKAMESISFMKNAASVKDEQIRKLEANSNENFHKLLKLERENLALASKNGPRELKIKRLENQLSQLKVELKHKEAETDNYKAQIWFPGFDNYN